MEVEEEYMPSTPHVSDSLPSQDAQTNKIVIHYEL